MKTVITLGDDWTEDELLTVKEYQNITLDLNGHTIKRNRNRSMKSDGSVFRVSKKAVLTLRDSNPKTPGYNGVKGGVVTGGACSGKGGGVCIDEGGEFRMEGGTIYDCIAVDGGAVGISGSGDGGVFAMTGGRIYSCKALESAGECYGGAVYLGQGTVTVSNATVDDCYSEDDGGAVYSERGTVTLKNTVFSGNRCNETGGAICTSLDTAKYQGTLLNAYNCTFAGNYAGEDGGAVIINDNPEKDGAVLFHNCKFRNNEAVKKGGAFYVNDDNVALSGCEITANKAGGEGGGVFVDDRYNITLKGLMKITDNTSGKGKGLSNLALEDGKMGTARIINGGLYKNSLVRVGSTSEKSVLVSEWMSQYQMKHFEADEGTLTAKDERTVNAGMVVTASIFSEGGMLAVIILGSAGIIFTAILIFRKRIKDGEENDQH